MTKPKIIISPAIPYQPHEMQVAHILLGYFKSDVKFIEPSMAYKQRSADFLILGIEWELKSPTGSSLKSTIEKQFKGLRQSSNLIIDGRRSKLNDPLLINRVAKEIRNHRSIKRLLYINKQGDVLALK